jgi:hypothetical protein
MLERVIPAALRRHYVPGVAAGMVYGGEVA